MPRQTTRMDDSTAVSLAAEFMAINLDAELSTIKKRQIVEILRRVSIQLKDIPAWRRQVWNGAVEACALLVQPVPHVDEERTCGEVAEEIRKLKMSEGGV